MKKNNTLFSIDVDSHLRSAATHTFGSPAHYPVELVRAALRRGARKVEVRIGRDRIQVTDDGAGLDSVWLETLSNLLEPVRPTGAREAAVEWMQTRGGFGMLALFAPAPKKILVENAPDLGKTQFLFHEGKLEKTNTCALNMGTRITLFFPGFRDMAREKRILQIYCQSVQRDIRLNNRIISRRPLLFHQMATLKITGSEYESGGIIGIPPTGDLCRVRLLDMGIPYRYVTLPPRKGFIFDAAVEYGNGAEEEITGEFLNH
ncbi:MAG: hypothetical protein GY950_28835, partial [bacterium]|nr:hypothetical protein [bacterium]